MLKPRFTYRVTSFHKVPSPYFAAVPFHPYKVAECHSQPHTQINGLLSVIQNPVPMHLTRGILWICCMVGSRHSVICKDTRLRVTCVKDHYKKGGLSIRARLSLIWLSRSVHVILAHSHVQNLLKDMVHNTTSLRWRLEENITIGISAILLPKRTATHANIGRLGNLHIRA
jgi:hypothetical protein